MHETDTVNNINRDQRNLLTDLNNQDDNYRSLQPRGRAELAMSVKTSKDKSSNVEGNLFEAQTSAQHARDHNFDPGKSELAMSQTADQAEFTRAEEHGITNYVSSQPDHGDEDILDEVSFEPYK